MKQLSSDAVLALHGLHLMLRKRKPITRKDISRSGAFEPAQVRNVLKHLLIAGLIERAAGRGFILGKAPGEIRILDIVRAVEVPSVPTGPCGGDFAACPTHASCTLAPICRRADEAYQDALRESTLEDLKDVVVDLPNCVDPRLAKILAS